VLGADDWVHKKAELSDEQAGFAMPCKGAQHPVKAREARLLSQKGACGDYESAGKVNETTLNT
jgi:hypothetical protein